MGHLSGQLDRDRGRACRHRRDLTDGSTRGGLCSATSTPPFLFGRLVVQSARKGGRVRTIAFFDMDKTILSDSSGILLMRYLYRTGQITWQRALYVLWLAIQYQLSVMDYARATGWLMPTIAGGNESDVWAMCREWFREMVAPRVTWAAVQRIEEHRREGHVVVVLSASTVYAVKFLAEHLELGNNFLCTYLEVRDGQFTGRVVEPSCYGANKVYWAGRFAAEHGGDLKHAYFYTDSYTDLALMERVGHPVAVNPDLRLRWLARRRGWPVERFY
jgi:HAD superfamily hydrolase (TIGR01490 family)